MPPILNGGDNLPLSQPSYASAVGDPLVVDTAGSVPPRDRIGSFKRKKLSSDSQTFEHQSFDHFASLSLSMATIYKELEGFTVTKNGKEKENAKIIGAMNRGLGEIETKLSDLAKFTFELAKDHDKVDERLCKLESTIKVNVASGDIVSNIENSAAYQKVCVETMNSNLISKIHDFDLGNETKGTHSSLIDTIKNRFEECHPSLPLEGVIITPLAKATVCKEGGKHIIPILLKSKSYDDRVKLDKELRTLNVNPSFHWPKDLVPAIKKIRSQLKAFKNDDVDLNNKQVCIRPTSTGKSLRISYRQTFNDSWTLLDNVKTPAPNPLILNTKFQQPCFSKFFKL